MEDDGHWTGVNLAEAQPTSFLGITAGRLVSWPQGDHALFQETVHRHYKIKTAHGPK